MKSGTTIGAAKNMMDKSNSGIHHGASNKNVVVRGKSVGKPSGPTSPIKGTDKGGV